jgi:hypothetical protein
VRLLPGPAADAARLPEVLETGIKVIDVLCPLVRSGTVSIAGEYRAGTLVVVEELCWRLRSAAGGVSIFAFVPPGPSRTSFQEAWEKEGHTGGTLGAVQTFYFAGEEEWRPEQVSRLPEVDVLIRLSRALADARIYPPVDALVSRSRLFEAAPTEAAPAEIAGRVRRLLSMAASADPAAIVPPAGVTDLERRRARKMWLFFAQPFFVAEPYTKRPGVFVSRAEALRACREILDGMHDDIPDEAFYFTGGIDDVLARVGGEHAGEDLGIGARAEIGHLPGRVVGAGAEDDGRCRQHRAVRADQGAVRAPERAPPVHRRHPVEAAAREERTDDGSIRTRQGEADAAGEAALLADEGAEPPRDLVEDHRGQRGLEAPVGPLPGRARLEARPHAVPIEAQPQPQAERIVGAAGQTLFRARHRPAVGVAPRVK